MRSIRDTCRVLSNNDLSKNPNEIRYGGEYWKEKD
jgi:hypothetical protein